MVRILCLALAVWLAFAWQPAESAVQSNARIIRKKNGRFSLYTDGSRLRQVLEQLSSAAGIRLVLPETISDRPVRLDIEDRTVEALFRSLLRGTSYALIYDTRFQKMKLKVMTQKKSGAEARVPDFASEGTPVGTGDAPPPRGGSEDPSVAAPKDAYSGPNIRIDRPETGISPLAVFLPGVSGVDNLWNPVGSASGSTETDAGSTSADTVFSSPGDNRFQVSAGNEGNETSTFDDEQDAGGLNPRNDAEGQSGADGDDPLARKLADRKTTLETLINELETRIASGLSDVNYEANQERGIPTRHDSDSLAYYKQQLDELETGTVPTWLH